jgi:TP901-1 family phage major tail protein
MRGDEFVLLISDGIGGFDQVGGLRATSYSINGEMIDLTDKDSNLWRELFDGGGNKSVTVSADGVWEGGTEQDAVQALALSQALEDFQLDDGNEVLEGAFQVTNFEKSGDQGDAQLYSITLESGDEPTLT